MNTSYLKVVSNGQPGGTHVLLSDGSSISKYIEQIDIHVDGDGVTLIMTSKNARLDIVAPSPDAAAGLDAEAAARQVA